MITKWEKKVYIVKKIKSIIDNNAYIFCTINLRSNDLQIVWKKLCTLRLKLQFIKKSWLWLFNVSDDIWNIITNDDNLLFIVYHMEFCYPKNLTYKLYDIFINYKIWIVLYKSQYLYIKNHVILNILMSHIETWMIKINLIYTLYKNLIYKFIHLIWCWIKDNADDEKSN